MFVFQSNISSVCCIISHPFYNQRTLFKQFLPWHFPILMSSRQPHGIVSFPLLQVKGYKKNKIFPICFSQYIRVHVHIKSSNIWYPLFDSLILVIGITMWRIVHMNGKRCCKDLCEISSSFFCHHQQIFSLYIFYLVFPCCWCFSCRCYCIYFDAIVMNLEYFLLHSKRINITYCTKRGDVRTTSSHQYYGASHCCMSLEKILKATKKKHISKQDSRRDDLLYCERYYVWRVFPLYLRKIAFVMHFNEIFFSINLSIVKQIFFQNLRKHKAMRILMKILKIFLFAGLRDLTEIIY